MQISKTHRISLVFEKVEFTQLSGRNTLVRVCTNNGRICVPDCLMIPYFQQRSILRRKIVAKKALLIWKKFDVKFDLDWLFWVGKIFFVKALTVANRS